MARHTQAQMVGHSHHPSGYENWLALLRIAQPLGLLAALIVCASLLAPSSSSPRRRRSGPLGSVVLAILFTYFAEGLLLVLRAVIPTDHQKWTPALPLWRNVDWQIPLDIIVIGAALILVAWQQRQAGPGRYSIQPIYAAITFVGVGDVLILLLYIIAKGGKHDWKSTTPWTWAQLALQILRIIVLWPILTVVASISHSTDPVSDEDARDGADARLAQNSEAASASVDRATEQTSLLQPSSGGHPSQTYGATSAGPSTNGHNTPTAASAAKAKSGAAAANASMGLSVAAQPPPPTFRVFFQRIILLFPYLWPSQSSLLQALAVFCVFLLIIGRFVNLAVPLMLGRIVDKLAGKETASSMSIWWLIAGYAGLRCLQGGGGALQVLQNMAWLPLQQYSDRHMSLMAFRHLLDLSMAFHSKRKTGEVLRILDRGSSINSFFQYLIFSIGPIFFDIVIATGFLSFTFGPQVGLLLLFVMIVYTAVSVQLTTWRTALRREANNKDSISRAIHTDVLLNYESVKVYANERYETQRYELSLRAYQEAEWKVNASLNVLNLVQNLLLATGTLLMLLLVAYDVVHGYASSSDFVVFISYLGQIYGPLNMLSTLYRVIQTSLVDTDKLIALLQEEKDIKDVPDAKPLEINTGVLEFRDVKFSYDGKVEALKGINFTIKPKSKVALVGETGCGKTTILRLLYRFYDPTSGSILIDGQDIRKVTQNSLRKAIGVVPQEAGLLNTSLKTNIAYGRTEPEATDEEIDAAAAAAQILDKIRSFPEGMDTVVGERGVRLSGGEKQRVAISRCFLKSPPILLLDEATSALDSQTERQIQTALATLLEGKTSLTIAHRLSTIVNSDQILVLHDGRVVESGSHEELIAVPSGRYAAMWQAQVETDNERAEKELREKETRGKERAVDGPATEATGQTETEVATEPQPGMLGIISSSQVNAALSEPSQTDAKEAPSETVDVPAAAPAPEESPLLAPAAADPAQTVEAEVSAPLASLDSTVEPTEVSGAGTELASPDQAASTAAVDVPAGGEAAAAPEQAPTLTPSTSRADSTAFPAAEEATSASPIVGSPAGSASGTSTPGKIRRRLTSLMKRTPSGSVPQSGAPDADGPSSSPTSLRRTASTRSAVGGSLSRSSSFKTGTGNRLGAESPSLKPPQAPAQGASSGSRSVSPSASSSGAVSPAAGASASASEAPKETSPKPPSTSGKGNLSSKKKKKKDKKKM